MKFQIVLRYLCDPVGLEVIILLASQKEILSRILSQIPRQAKLAIFTVKGHFYFSATLEFIL